MTNSKENPGGWPDPMKPGVPLEPHRDSAHAFRWASGEEQVYGWNFVSQVWEAFGRTSTYSAKDFANHPGKPVYLGPCHTLYEAISLVGTTQTENERLRQALKEIKSTAKDWSYKGGPFMSIAEICDAALNPTQKEEK